MLEKIPSTYYPNRKLKRSILQLDRWKKESKTTRTNIEPKAYNFESIGTGTLTVTAATCLW